MQNLYEYINGPWLASHTIPADRGVDGIFHALRDAAEADVHRILQANDGRAGALYTAFMDTEALSRAGVEPLNPDLERIDAAQTPEDLARVLGELDREGVGAPVGFWVAKDSEGDTDVAYLVQSGLGLPDEAYYRSADHAETLAAYREHVEKMLSFLPSVATDSASAAEAATTIVNLETSLAQGHWDVVDSRDAIKTNNPTEFTDLPEIIQTLLRAARLPERRLIVREPSYVEHLAGLLTQERLPEWKLWATWHLLSSRAGVLSPEISAANFDFFGRRLSGATEQRERWKRAVGLAESLVGYEIGRAYVEEHFPASSKKQMLTLVDYLTAAYRERITALDWMTEATKQRALEKLGLFQAKIGYPATWRSYEGLTFSARGEDLVANVRAGSAFLHDYEVNKVGKPTDRAEWVSTPQTVNAFYNPTVNDITFPAAILQPPFFDPEADAAENFGAIGAVIGHEIGHGFDDQGSQYDGHGNLHSWWSGEDRAAFGDLTEKLVEQFDGLVPSVLREAAGASGVEAGAGAGEPDAPGTSGTPGTSDAPGTSGTPAAAAPGVNGRFTLGENIGDLGGLGIAVVAYKNWLADHGQDGSETARFEVEGADPAVAETEFTGFQRLFLSWARVWRTAIRPEMATQYLAIDPHSPAEFRCNVIAANVAEFYEAFPEIGPDSPMWVAPEDRVRIW
ncbi:MULTISPECIES: M13 family metallopeptidase [unclassified Corynebacterium]|uniref:M13 family metallopeptidase n=1 Tax=unclassified Corynebacterium TaxID=2624378 RepID=UPI0029C9FDC0|nr:MULTISPECIES: M13-type metalloendopeptidase [unclassified Corynebacterium]WPF66228.1 M13-type metalloendopeptidase [Corynebacterium sp. 22KM0430]WPF68718.1 M13-type metalloendopeptidase [Corynebacterium sp. 21KM1197]